MKRFVNKEFRMVRTLSRSRWAGSLLWAAAVLALSPLAAVAELVPPIVRISDGTTTFTVPEDSFTFDPETNQFESTGSITAPGDFQFGWDLATNPDPLVIGTISVLNFSGVTNNYTLTYIQPASPLLNAPTTSKGSIEIGVQNVDGGGTAVLTTAGLTPIYQALIDGVPQASLLNTANLTATGSQGIVSTSAAFGPIGGGPAVNTDIGIEVNFSLTGGFDLASGTVFYQVVPEPSTIATLALGMTAMLGLAWARRRSS